MLKLNSTLVLAFEVCKKCVIEYR